MNTSDKQATGREAIADRVRAVRGSLDSELGNPPTDYSRGFKDGADAALRDVLDMLDEAAEEGS